jgi:hypothetical protein
METLDTQVLTRERLNGNLAVENGRASGRQYFWPRLRPSAAFQGNERVVLILPRLSHARPVDVHVWLSARTIQRWFFRCDGHGSVDLVTNSGKSSLGFASPKRLIPGRDKNVKRKSYMSKENHPVPDAEPTLAVSTGGDFLSA